MKRFALNFLLLISSLIALSACSFESNKSELRPRTELENQAINDLWYPIKNDECQLIVDGFNLVRLALGNGDFQYLLSNSDKIKIQLRTTGDVVSSRFLELAKNTADKSIREYVLEAVPIFAKLQNLTLVDLDDFENTLEYLEEWATLTEKVPDGCKS